MPANGEIGNFTLWSLWTKRSNRREWITLKIASHASGALFIFAIRKWNRVEDQRHTARVERSWSKSAALRAWSSTALGSRKNEKLNAHRVTCAFVPTNFAPKWTPFSNSRTTTSFPQFECIHIQFQIEFSAHANFHCPLFISDFNSWLFCNQICF